MLEMLKARKEALQERGVKGFTLMEMLIVIAIIAVLVAIAIPVLGAQLDRARATTDEANIRDGYASMQVEILQPTDSSGNPAASVTNGTYILQKDGSVKIDGGNDYECQGKSESISSKTDKSVEVAGVNVTWGAGDKIYFHVNGGKLTGIDTTAATS